MDKLEKLYLTLIENGLLSEEIPFEDFQSQYTSNQDYNKQVYDAAVDNDLTSEDYQAFSSFYSPELSVTEINVNDEIEDVVKPIMPTVPPTGEKDTAIERQFGKNFVTDFFGDIYRAGAQGIAQGATVDDALKVFEKGEDISDEDLQDYINSINEMESYGSSDEMKEFQKIYEEGGKGVLGFVKGIYSNPSVIPQLFTSSVAAMINPAVAAGAGAGALAGAATGAALGAPTGFFAGVTASGGAIAGAIGGMSGVLEAGLSYTEFLKDEIEKKGLEFNNDGIRDVLEDVDALKRIRNKSLARGISIAAIDALSGGLATKVTTSVARGAASKAAGALVGGTVEAVGGSVGETLARAITGQEMDIAEIGFEGVAGTATAPITVTRGLIKSPSYTVNKSKVSRRTIQDIIETSDPIQVVTTDFGVKNDPDLTALIQEKRADALIELNIDRAAPNLTPEDKTKVIALEKEKQKLTGNDTEVSKRRLSTIKTQIEDIISKYDEVETKVESTNEEALAALANDGIAEPTEAQVIEKLDQLNKEKLDAIQEPSTEEIPVQEQPGVSEEVVEEVPIEQEPAQEGEQEVTYSLPEDPAVAANDFEIIDNRDGKADLEIEGKEGSWYVRNKVTDKIVATTTKKEAQSLVDNPDWDYGEGDAIVQVAEEVRNFVTTPSIKKPFILASPSGRPSNTQVNFTEDGKVESIVNKKTGKEVTASTKSKAEKRIIDIVLDVDSGVEAELQEGMTPEQVISEIVDNSNNVREVALAIKFEEEFVKNKISQSKEFSSQGSGLFSLVGEKFTPDSWVKASGVSIKEMEKGNPGFIRTWIRTKKKFGHSIQDGAKGFDTSQIVSFIEKYPTASILRESTGREQGLTNNLDALKEKFTLLTGIQATPSNIEAVINVEEGRKPIALIEQEAAERAQMEASEPGVFGKKKGPSPNKITGEAPTMVTVDEAKALTDQIRLEARAARDSKKNQDAKRKSLSNAISLLAKRGTISIKKASNIIKKISSINLDNSINLERALSYVEKIFENADNKSRLDQAESLRKKIRKNYKKVEATVSDAAREFLQIDPWLVEDINEYISVASQVSQGLRPTTRASITPAVDLKNMQDYSFDALNKQNEIKVKVEQEAFEDLTGLSARDFSLAEMRSIIYNMDEPTSEKAANEKEKQITDGLKKAFDVYSNIVDKQLEIGLDPFTGESISFTKKQKEIANDFINMNLDLLNAKQKMVALDALINFASNATTGGMSAMVSEYNGILESNKVAKKGIAAKQLNIFGTAKSQAQAWIKNISNLNNAFEILFKSKTRANEVMEAMGLEALIFGASSGAKKAEIVFDKLVKKVKKFTPNNQDPFSVYNNTEIGMYADVKRTVDGTKEERQAEFERNKQIARESYEDLLASQDDKKVKLGEVYKEVYDKILKDSNTIEDVEAKVDKDNITILNETVKVWSEFYPELKDVSLNFYNKKLGDEVFYTPRSYSRLKKTKDTPDITEAIYNPEGSKRAIYDEKTGVLKESTKPKTLRKADGKPNRYVNYSFYSNNFSGLKSALIDANTAGPIRQIKGFQSTDAYAKIFPNEKDIQIVEERIKKYVDIKRGVSGLSRTEEDFLNLINKVATIGVARTLGGLTQPIKQFVPFVNTAVNAGIENTYLGAKTAGTNIEANAALNNLGIAISTRGVGSLVDLKSINNKLNNLPTSNSGKMVKALDDVSKQWIKYTLVNPDVLTARSSFFAYYFQQLKKNGVEVENIDWNNHQWDMSAATYAQKEVDRQQNVSDQDLQGDLFTSQNPYVQFSRKVFFPFANFLLNQKSRMYSDITTLISDVATPEDKTNARKSLGGLAAETIAFNGISYAISQALVAASFAMMGKEESEEDEKIRKGFQKTGKLGNIVSDILIPLPVMNDPGMQVVNFIIDLVQDSDDPFQFFANDEKTLSEQLGVLGIAGQKLGTMKELILMAKNGESKKTFMGKERVTKLSKVDQDAMKVNAVAYMLFLAGALPSEVGYLTDRNMKIATKKDPKTNKISKEDLKKINKELYNKIYGPGSSYYKNQQIKKNLKKK